MDAAKGQPYLRPTDPATVCNNDMLLKTLYIGSLKKLDASRTDPQGRERIQILEAAITKFESDTESTQHRDTDIKCILY
eukprot:SAG11_NODE_26123_length_349_cov_1.216000_1_plen_78_part_01